MKSEWYTFWDDALGSVRLEFNSTLVFLHVQLRQPMAGMRAIRCLFPALKDMLRALGHRHVYVLIPEGDDKLYRFEKLFGFEERRRHKGRILMRQEC